MIMKNIDKKIKKGVGLLAIFFTTASTAGFISCSEDDEKLSGSVSSNTIAAGYDTDRFAQKISGYELLKNGEKRLTSEAFFTSTDNKLTSITMINYEYYSDDEIDKYTEVYAFDYKKDEIVMNTVTPDGSGQGVPVVMNLGEHGYPQSLVGKYQASIWVDEDKKITPSYEKSGTFTYDTNNRLTEMYLEDKITYSDEDLAWLKQNQYWYEKSYTSLDKFTYDENGNLTTYTSREKEEGERAYTDVVTFTYTSYKNKNGFFITDAHYMFPYASFVFKSTPNLVKEITEENNHKYTYDYEFDEDGYVTKVIETENNSGVIEYIFEY